MSIHADLIALDPTCSRKPAENGADLLVKITPKIEAYVRAIPPRDGMIPYPLSASPEIWLIPNAWEEAAENSTFAGRLTAARKARNLTQAETAEKLGISRQAYVAIERAQAIPSKMTLAKIAEIFDISSNSPRKSEFAENLTAARIARNISQAQVAEILGISQASYNAYEIGKSLPSPKIAPKIAEIFGIDGRKAEISRKLTFSEALKTARKSRKLTQAQAADLVGISLLAYANYERGQSIPKRRESRAKIAEIFGITPENCEIPPEN